MNEDNELDYGGYSAVELQDILSLKYDSLLKDKRTKESKNLLKEYNKLVSLYNLKVKDRIYKTIK